MNGIVKQASAALDKGHLDRAGLRTATATGTEVDPDIAGVLDSANRETPSLPRNVLNLCVRMDRDMRMPRGPKQERAQPQQVL